MIRLNTWTFISNPTSSLSTLMPVSKNCALDRVEQTEDWVGQRQINQLISIQLTAIFIRLWSESMEYGMMNDCVSDSTSWHISNRCLCVSPIDPVCNDETDMTGDETRIYNYYWVGVGKFVV